MELVVIEAGLMIVTTLLHPTPAARILDALISRVEEENGLKGQDIDVDTAIGLASPDMARAIKIAEDRRNPADEIEDEEIATIVTEALMPATPARVNRWITQALTATDDE